MLDRHYTPNETAREVASLFDGYTTLACADTSCGDGSLLVAATEAFDGVHCVGVDADAKAIRRLKRRHPDWSLLCGDSLSTRNRRRLQAFARRKDVDLLCLNPPFSMRDKKGIEVDLEGRSVRVSVAMAHILRALHHFSPTNGVAAIVPESLMHSQLDDAARTYLETHFEPLVSKGLKNTTFRGVRANALVVRWLRRDKPLSASGGTGRRSAGWPPMRIVRGGLPMFEARTRKNGLPYVHTTDLAALVSSTPCVERTVQEISRGVVAGHCVLLPRVGVPILANLRPVLFPREVQLSDCVFALCCDSHEDASALATMLRRRGAELQELYRGTGARYTTLARLEEYLGLTSPR